MTFDAQAWWRDPEEYVHRSIRDVDRLYCSPLFYVDIPGVSELLADTIEGLVSPPSKILEVGCSCGRNMLELHKRGYTVKGIEINPAALDVAFEPIAEFIEIQSIEDYLMNTKEKFDVIVSSNVLMHIPPESEWVFAELASRTKYLVTLERESFSGHLYKWARNYQSVFENLGMVQLFGNPCGLESLPPTVILRTFHANRS